MKLLYTFFLGFLYLSISAQTINIPDENFKQALISEGVDSNSDGEIQVTEALATKQLTLTGQAIIDLTGIHEFKNLVSLHCTQNEITSLDLGVLDSIEILDLSDNPLTKLEYSSIPNIVSITLNEVELSSIKISNLSFLEVFNYSARVEIEDTIVLMNLPLLSSISFLEAKILELDNLGALTFFESHPPKNERISISNCLALESLDLHDVQIGNLENLPNLKNIDLFGVDLNGVDLNAFLALEHISLDLISSNNDDVFFKNLPFLESLHFASSGSLTPRLELSNLPSLTLLEIMDDVMELILRDIPLLRQIDNLEAIHPLNLLVIENMLSFEDLSLFSPEIQSLTMRNLPNLRFFTYMGGYLEVIDLRSLPSLESVNIEDGGSALKRLYMRDLKTTFLTMHFDNYQDGLFICADQEELDNIEQEIMNIDPEGELLDKFILTQECSIYPLSGFNLVEGEVILDYNKDGCDESDPKVPSAIVQSQNGALSLSGLTNNVGYYRMYVYDGLNKFNVGIKNEQYYSIDPDSFEVEFPLEPNTYRQDICLTPDVEFNDLKIQIIPLEEIRPGFETEFLLSYSNDGVTLLSGEIEFEFDDLISSYVTSSDMGFEQQSRIHWEFTDLKPQEERSVNATLVFNTPMDMPPLEGDEELCFSATISPIMDDETPENNIHTIKSTVVNSHDPNDKTCLQGEEITPEMVGEYVDYLIRFENTGTASAINVLVADRIDTTVFEISTLQIIKSSHDMRVEVIEGNLVQFIFEEIYLPFDDDNNDGFVSFSIKTKDDLELGDVMENTAEIYFDFNWPIITNTAKTEVKEPVGLFEINSNFQLSVFPNPTSDFLSLESDEPIKSLNLIDVDGRLIWSVEYIPQAINPVIDISRFNSGQYWIKVESGKGIASKLLHLE